MEKIVACIFILVLVAVISFSYFFSKKAVIKRKLKNAPFKRLSEFRDGNIAKIIGEVEFVDRKLTAPLSGRKCAYYHVLVEEEDSSGKSSAWKTLITEEKSVKP